MRFKKSFGLLFVLLLTPLVLAGVVQSVGPPTIYVNVSSYGITVYGNNWTPYTDVTIYYDVEDAAHMVAVVEANYGGYFQTRIPTDYIPTVGTHTEPVTARVRLGLACFKLFRAWSLLTTRLSACWRTTQLLSTIKSASAALSVI